MTGKQRIIRTLEFEPVDRLPIDLWRTHYIEMFRSDELRRFLAMYPQDMIKNEDFHEDFHYGQSRYSKGEPFRKGRYVDEFGSVLEVLEEGVMGEVVDPVIKSKTDLDHYRMPWEIIDDAEYTGQLKAYKKTDLYVKIGTYVKPFERMQWMRGTEQLFIDLATEDPIFLQLKDMVHEFCIRNVKLAASLATDGVTFADDWGSQQSLLISPESWRKHFKPMYKEYCELLHKAGKHVFLHSDGNIEAIYEDLIEVGFDAINSQLFCMDIEMLGEKYAGKIAFWGEIDRQHILPFGTEEEVRAAVRRVGKAMLSQKRTGLFAQLCWDTVMPFSNIAAAFDEFSKL